MDISLKTLANIDNSLSNDIKQYLKQKYNFRDKLDKDKIHEIKSIYKFLVKNLDKGLLRKINTISFFINLFKYEYDGFLGFYKKNKRIIIDIEIKRNSSQEKVDHQIIEHLRMAGSRLQNNYIIYGISIVESKNTHNIFKYNFKNKKVQKIKNDLNNIFKDIFEKKFIQETKSDWVIKEMQSSINETISICKAKDINLTKSELDLINWINEKIINNDILLIDANGGVGKTTIAFKLFFDEFYLRTNLLLNNYRLKKNILNDYTKEKWFNLILWYPNQCKNNKINDFIIIDEGQRLNEDQIIYLSNIYKKLIIFGDKYQSFEAKYDCNFGDIDESIFIDKKILYRKYESDTHRRNSKYFPNLIKYIFNSKKYLLKNKNIKINEKFFLYDEIDKFIQSYKNQILHKKMFTQKFCLSEVCKNNLFIQGGFNELIGVNNPLFAIDNDYQSIGLVYNAYSFEIDAVYLIIKSELGEIAKNNYLFNEIYTICTRTKKELHILLISENIKDYCSIKKNINQRKIQYEN